MKGRITLKLKLMLSVSLMVILLLPIALPAGGPVIDVSDDIFVTQSLYLNYDHPLYHINDDDDDDDDHDDDDDKSAHVRKAISLAIDRHTIVDLMSSLVPDVQESVLGVPIMALSSEEFDLEKYSSYNFRLNRAANILEENDYPTIDADDFGDMHEPNVEPNLVFLVPNSNPIRIQWAQMIVSNLNIIGMGIQLNVWAWSNNTHPDESIIVRTFLHPSLYDDNPDTSVPLYKDGGFDALFIGYSHAYNGDLQLFIDEMYKQYRLDEPAYNFMNYESNKFDKHYSKENLSKMIIRVYKDLPIIGLIQYTSY